MTESERNSLLSLISAHDRWMDDQALKHTSRLVETIQAAALQRGRPLTKEQAVAWVMGEGVPEEVRMTLDALRRRGRFRARFRQLQKEIWNG